MNLDNLHRKHPRRRAFVTGGVSGLGKALCVELAKHGWNIGIADLNTDNFATTKKELTDIGGNIYTYQLDVANAEQYEQVAKQALSDLGGMDLLVNNAGVPDGNFFSDLSLADWQWIISINQMGVIHGCHFFLPEMKKQGSGVILNTASAAAYACSPRMTSYSSTKAAVLGFSESLWGEVESDGIQVSVSMPLFFRTDLAKNSRGPSESLELTKWMVEGAKHGAEEVAQSILNDIDKGKLYCYGMSQSKWLHRVKRWFPNWFNNGKLKMAKNQEKLQRKAKKQYEERQKS